MGFLLASLHADYAGLNEAIHHPPQVACLYTGFPVGGAVWEGLGSVALLEEARH